MEGPSLKLAEEQLKPFKTKKVIKVSGNTKIGKERLVGLQIINIFSWGKHLVFQFGDFALRVHFMLFGTFEAVIKGESITGDYKRARVPRLEIIFSNGKISLFNCSLKYIEDKKAKSLYDFSSDTMSSSWDPLKAYKKLKSAKEEQIGDALLDQEIFAGVGNIIKNEVLFITRINPKTIIKNISSKKIKEIIKVAQEFCIQFFKWRKKFILRKNLIIYQKSKCPNCENKIKREKTGKRARWSYYCPICQPIK